jgi:hypothetical protein
MRQASLLRCLYTFVSALSWASWTPILTSTSLQWSPLLVRAESRGLGTRIQHAATPPTALWHKGDKKVNDDEVLDLDSPPESFSDTLHKTQQHALVRSLHRMAHSNPPGWGRLQSVTGLPSAPATISVVAGTLITFALNNYGRLGGIRASSAVSLFFSLFLPEALAIAVLCGSFAGVASLPLWAF